MLAVALLAAGSSTAAGNVTRVTGIDISETIGPLPLSDECGFDVFRQVTGTATVTLIRNASGDVVREIDTAPGSRVTFFAPSQGTSFSYEGNLVFHTLYPEGATLGAPATVTVTGLQGHVAGIGADAGFVEFQTTVTGFSPEGIPITGDPIGTVVEHGNREAGSTVVAAICARLTA